MTEDQNTSLRMFIALKLLREFGLALSGNNDVVVDTIVGWIDGGMKGPIPWPKAGVFFDQWAADHGYSRVGDSIGFHLEFSLLKDFGKAEG